MSRGPEAPVVGRCAFALRDPCGQVLVARSPCGTLADRLPGEKRKKKFWSSRESWESLMRAGPTTLGAALDAGERSGPRWTGDAWLARRWRYSTARRERAHNLKEVEGRAGTVRSNQRSSNTLYCRVNVCVKLG